MSFICAKPVILSQARNLVVSLTLLFICNSCAEKQDRMVDTSFYHWKTELALTEPEISYLEDLEVKQIYLRFFDVDWDGYSGVPLPIAVMEKQIELPDHLAIIPTIFITNRTFQHLKTEAIPLFVENVINKIKGQAEEFLATQIKEIQIDCDWSESTRIKYFDFLSQLRAGMKNQDVELSTTIRLHQVKYYKTTGVPPVDKGVLMFYNMGKLEDPNTENSILDLSVAEKYLQNFPSYPLKLDIALPLFSWGVLFREGKMVQLINELTQADLQDQKRFLKISQNKFELLKSTYIEGHYLYQGDRIRLEGIEVESLKKAADLISPLIKTKQLRIIFYHLHPNVVKMYPHDALEDICNRFR